MHELLVILQWSLSALLLTALLGGSNKPLLIPDTQGALSGFLFKAISVVHAPYVLYICFLLLAGDHAVAIGLLGMLMFAGLVIRSKHETVKCNCYGALSDLPGGQKSLTVVVIVLSCAILCVGYWWSAPVSLLDLAIRYLSALVLVTLANLLVPGLFQRWKRSAKYGAYSDSNTDGPSYPSSMPVGALDNGEVVTFGRIAQTCPIFILVGITSDCSACSYLKPYLLGISERLGESLRIVFVARGLSYPEEPLYHTLFLTGAHEFASEIEGLVYPFAILVNSETLTRMGRVYYGENICSLLLSAGRVSGGA